jgi:hypothetical protein
MPRLQNKTNPDVIINVADTDPLPGGPSEWEPAGTAHNRTRRRADTGTVPVQKNQQ